MFTFLLNVTFALLAISSLNGAFDNGLQENISLTNQEEIVKNYLTSVKELVETLKSNEPSRAEINDAVEKITAKIEGKLKKPCTMLPDLTRQITELTNLAFNKHALPLEIQEAFANKY